MILVDRTIPPRMPPARSNLRPPSSGGSRPVATILVSRTNHCYQSQRLREFTDTAKAYGQQNQEILKQAQQDWEAGNHASATRRLKTM